MTAARSRLLRIQDEVAQRKENDALDLPRRGGERT